jgi:hypothetical protein
MANKPRHNDEFLWAGETAERIHCSFLREASRFVCSSGIVRFSVDILV